MNWRITSHVRDAILAHAAREGHREACGLLLGQPGDIVAHIETSNVAAQPERGFEIDPTTLLAAHRDARGDGGAVVGWYHSHPNGRGEPSATDAARAVEDGKLWVIAAAGGITGWTAGRDGLHGRFAPAALIVAD